MIAFILSLIVVFVISVAPQIIKTFQALAIYGSGDPQLMAGGISEAIVTGMMSIGFLWAN